MANNSELKEHFVNHHILGLHSAYKKRNQVADFKKMKYKTVTKIERIPGKYPGQTKVITEVPIKFSETGYEYEGKEGESHFLLTGIKSEKSFIPQHLDGMVTQSRNGKFYYSKEGEIFKKITDLLI